MVPVTFGTDTQASANLFLPLLHGILGFNRVFFIFIILICFLQVSDRIINFFGLECCSRYDTDPAVSLLLYIEPVDAEGSVECCNLSAVVHSSGGIPCPKDIHTNDTKINAAKNIVFSFIMHPP